MIAIPPLVFRATKDWVFETYGIGEGAEIVRPFYPGGDYESYDYPEGCVVIDNPPFSILAQIIKFYTQRGIRYFLFGPHLVLIASARKKDCCVVPCGVKVTYENGAIVNTSFITNLEDNRFHVFPDLYERLEKANNEAQAKAGCSLFGYGLLLGTDAERRYLEARERAEEVKAARIKKERPIQRFGSSEREVKLRRIIDKFGSSKHD